MRQYSKMIKDLERFKKTCSSIIILLMIFGCALTIFLYVYKMTQVVAKPYFVTRTYLTETKIVDFE